MVKIEKGIITLPTKDRMGLRIGLSTFGRNQVVIQNYNDASYDCSVYLDFTEIDNLIKALAEIKKLEKGK